MMQHEEERPGKQPRVLPSPPKHPRVDPIVADAARDWQVNGSNGILSDTQGSYTGTPVDGERPIQDADDL